MNDKLSQAIEDLAAWRTTGPTLSRGYDPGHTAPRVCFGSNEGPIFQLPTIPGGMGSHILRRFVAEPEFQEATEALYKAIDGLKTAREAIIERKARELAALVHGDQLSGIQKLVSEIQGTGA